MPQFILSPCGTSLLTHGASEEIRSLTARYANEKNPQNIPAAKRHILEDWIRKAQAQIEQANFQEAARRSAELNCLLKLYDNHFPTSPDQHWLLCTDTWLGKVTAEMVKHWLNIQAPHFQVNILKLSGLQTQSLEDFHCALAELVRWLSETVLGYRQSGYRIIFNLTGGFKSIQGFLQSLAHFYADESVYIFERAEQLLRIPRLPIQLATTPMVEKHLFIFRRLSQGLPVQLPADFPSIFLFQSGPEATLSAWGEVVWNEAKQTLYQQKLHDSPSPQIRFSPHFQRTAEALAPDRLAHINTRLDQLARCLESQGHYNPNALSFQPLRGNPVPPSTHECYAWSDEGAWRIFGHFENQGDQRIFILDQLGPHLR